MNPAPSTLDAISPSSTDASTGARLVAADGRTLPLRGASLAVDAKGGVARVVVEQRFHNAYAEPLSVTYSLPLPADGAVSGFSFRIGGRVVTGEIDRRREARERYEQALVEGRSAALLEQDRSSLFTQEIGNIPPGEEIVAEVIVDQRLRWLDEGAWEWRFPTVVAPRYLGAAGRVEDAERVTQDVADGPLPARVSMRCAIRDALPEGRRPESPSHPIDAASDGAGATATLREGAALDRDVVVRWTVATPEVGLSLDAGRPAAGGAAEHAYGVLTVVPPSREGGLGAVPRDLIVLLDTSGSMAGEPLSQARRVTIAMIETLREHDQLELIEFSSSARRWRPGPVAAGEAARRDAVAWLGRLRASGGTEMRTGILEALGALRATAQRQVVLVTDGLIGFESEVVRAICERLPASCRLHTVGVGSAVNRSLTGLAARAGRGVEVVVGLGEDPERAASRLVARTNAPLVVELEVSGSALIEHAPRRLPDLFAGAPALIGAALRPEGGELVVRGRTASGPWEQRLAVKAVEIGGGSRAAAALFGREAAEDLELRLAAGADRSDVDAAIEAVGMRFQIATRLTSWIAVSDEVTVDPNGSFRRQRMPHELPHGMSAEGVGLRPAATAVLAGAPMAPTGMARPMAAMAMAPFPARSRHRQRVEAAGAAEPMMKRRAEGGRVAGPPPAEAPAAKEGLLSRAKKAIFGERAEEAKPPPPPPTGAPASAPAPGFWAPPGPPPPAGPAPAAPPSLATRRLRGRLALRRGDEAIVAVTIDASPLDWDPGETVELTLDDGRVVEAKVVAERSTRGGALAPGQSLRICVKLPPGAEHAGVREIAVRRGGERLIIDVG